MTDSAIIPEVLDQTTMIKLPEKAVSGLAPMNIQLMKQTAVDVNNSWAVAGNAIKASCERLYNLKKNVKRGNWTAFIKSGVLNISAKNASDLANAYDKWLVFSDDVPDSLLSTMTPRTLSAVANADERTRSIILSKVVSAVKTSEADVRKIIKEATPNKNKLKISKDGDKSKGSAKKDLQKKHDEKILATPDHNGNPLGEQTKVSLIQSILMGDRRREELEEQVQKLKDELEFVKAGN